MDAIIKNVRINSRKVFIFLFGVENNQNYSLIHRSLQINRIPYYIPPHYNILCNFTEISTVRCHSIQNTNAQKKECACMLHNIWGKKESKLI